MRRILLLFSIYWLSLGAFAAIITERNDVYKGLGCYAPSRYTFVGSSSHPGIESCWIPYGTYTGGTGGTEYTRVTDHLMGVVASALAGLSEREQYSPFMLRPMGIPNGYSYWTDDGAFLESPTNQSLRIADQFNLPLMYVRRDGTNYTYTVTAGQDNCLEPRILECAKWFGSRGLESLITAQEHSIEPPISSEWSTDVPYNVSDTNLWRYVYPVLGYCTNDIHFLPAGGIGQGNWNAFPYGWGMSSLESIWGNDVVQGYWDVVWGTDGNPLPFTIEDVLSYDTRWKYEVPPVCTNDLWTVSGPIGKFRLNKTDATFISWVNFDSISWLSLILYDWGYRFDITEASTLQTIYQYDTPGDYNSEFLSLGDYTAQRTRLYADTDDYVHWRNGSTRLDWKRLGIICQLERQMDTKYEPLSITDELPLWHMTAGHMQAYSTTVDIPLPHEVYKNGQTFGPIENIFKGAEWSTFNSSYSSTTNKDNWSSPTCRTTVPSFMDTVTCYGDYGSPIYLDDEKAEEMINHLAGQLESVVYDAGDVTGEVKMAHIELFGDWDPPADDSLSLAFRGQVGGAGTFTTWSNTVYVVSSDGIDDNKKSNQRLDKENWEFIGPDGCAATVEFLRHGRCLSSSAVAVSYSNKTGSFYYEAAMQFDNIGGGGVSPPTLVLSATGFDIVSNWVWVVEGDPRMPVYLSSYDAVDGRVTWTFGEYSGGDGNGGVITCWTSRDVMDIHFQYMAGNRQCYCSYDASDIPLSRFWTTGSVGVTWESLSETEELFFHFGRSKDYAAIIGEWDGLVVHYDFTNSIRDVHAYLYKSCSATITYDESDAMNDTTGRFESAYSLLDWSRLYSLRRSELELLISAEGSASHANDINPSGDDIFTWQEIKNYSGSEREFRMVKGATERNQQHASLARYNQLVSLSSACKRKCRTKGGLSIGNIEDVGKITNSDKDDYLRALRDATIGGTFEIRGIHDFHFEADIHKEDEEYVIDSSDPSLPCRVGGCGWVCNFSYDKSSAMDSSKYKAVRADGFQAPVLKTVWKFKNLRDPNL